MIIRQAKKSDLKECEKLTKIPELQLGYSERYPDVKYLGEFLDDIFLVVEDESTIVGCLVAEKEKAGVVSLNILVVDKNYRGKKVGKTLMNEFVKISRKMKLKDIYLLAPKWNKKTLKFYKSLGFLEMKNYSYFTKEL